MQRVNSDGTAICGSTNDATPNLLDVQFAGVMELELRALRAWLKNDLAGTEQFLKQATALENSISYSYGPPDIIKPSNELYGDWLVKLNRPKEALIQYDLALKAAPKRVLSMKGKDQASKASSLP